MPKLREIFMALKELPVAIVAVFALGDDRGGGDRPADLGAPTFIPLKRWGM